jgi:Subtilase family/Fibronectin type-III domain/Peptidase inhibitor I9/PA domain
MFRLIRYAAALAVLAAAVQVPAHLQAAQDSQDSRSAPRDNGAGRTNNLYIVQMLEFPVGSYTGGVPGFAATKPGRGQKINPNNPNVIGYAGYLDGRHTAALDRVGGRKVYDYRYSFNGFAAELTEAQAQVLRSVAGVVAVTKDELRTVDTSSTPTFLGLTAPGGLWEVLGGVKSAGENVIIGVVDSGIWPESLSFTDRTGPNGSATQDGKLSYRHLPGWHGHCIEGEAFPEDSCNQKLIGARYFNEAWGGDEGIEAERPWEFTSPRDYNGHGTHTSSTAGGNSGVVTTGAAAVFGPISGIAPRARIATYKALWSTQDGALASGFNSDLVAAIDQAVADGVDVINYSVSGSSTNFLDPAEVSFLFAADAGVFVSTSAGNAGITGSVAHPGPWVATVAAGTHNRDGRGSVTLGNGTTYNGASVAAAFGPAPLIDAEAAGLPGADATAVRLCFTATDNGGDPVLDPAKVAGKIVVCDRGVSGRTNKSAAVKQAGGVGMILLNTNINSINADLHFVPSVHVIVDHRAAIKAYAATAGATAKINQSTLVYDAPAPFTAAFSSRGPLAAGGGDVLKPDLMAPGNDILAATAPPSSFGQSFNVYSGTSMSAPHVAGLAALLKDLHEDWSPMMIKSALMTSGTDVLDASLSIATRIFRQGAGHVVPNGAMDPGLVYDSNILDWLAMLCGKTTGVNPATCSSLVAAGYSLDASDLNSASIAIGDVAGVQTIQRRVTNVGFGEATYTPSVSGVTGFTVAVTPPTLSIGPGETESFEVTLTRTTAGLNAYAGGQLTWSDGSHNVRSPIVVRPVALAAPAQVSGTGGPINYTVKFGYDGPFTATARGLIPATTNTGSVADDPADEFDPEGEGVASFPFTIAAGTTYARFSLFDSDVAPASDLDLYVIRKSDGVLVGASGTGTSTEEVNLLNPAAGDYTAYVHGWGVPAPGPATFTLFSWLLGSADAGNMNVTAPATATTGGSGTIGLTFTGLTPGTKYLGSVAYGDGVSALPVNPTIVRVDP